MNRGAVLVAVVAGLALGALGIKSAVDAQRPKGSDTLQILRLLQQGEAAAERRDAAGVNHFLSENYRDAAGLTGDQVRFQVGQYLRRHTSVDLEIPSSSVQVGLDPGGQTGTVRFLARMSVQSSAGSMTSEMPLSLRLAKEKVYYFWLFPGEEWRVTGVEGYSMLE